MAIDKNSLNLQNGHGTMVVMSIETFSKMTENIALALDVADKYVAEGRRVIATTKFLRTFGEKLMDDL